MSVASDMVKAYPAEINLDRELLARCVDACVACAQACTACADACLSEEMIDELRKCIRSDLDAPTSVRSRVGCCLGTPAMTPT
jgi:hypothetical protein